MEGWLESLKNSTQGLALDEKEQCGERDVIDKAPQSQGQLLEAEGFSSWKSSVWMDIGGLPPEFQLLSL